MSNELDKLKEAFEDLKEKPAILAALQSGKLDMAERMADQWLDKDPKNVDAQYLTGLVLLMKGDISDAIIWLEKAHHLSPQDEVIACNLGQAYFKNEEYAKAEPVLRAALALKKDYSEALYNLSCALLEGDKASEALKTINQLIQLVPNHANYMCAKADILRSLSQWPQALKQYHRANKQDNNLVRAHINISPILLHMGKAEEAKEHCDKAIELAPTEISARKHLGDVLVQMEELDDAMDAYADAFEIDPQSDALCIAIAQVWLEIGNFQEAGFWYQRAFEIDENNIKAKCGLAMLTKERGDNLSAIEMLEPLLEEEEDNIDVRLVLSDALWDEGDAEGAIEHLRVVLEKQPHRVATHAKIGQLLSSAGDIDEALKEYEIALSQQKNCVPALNGLATTERAKLDPKYVASMEKMLTRPGLKDGAKGSLNSGLAYFYDGSKENKKAAEHMLAANKSQWAFKSKRGWEYENEQQEKHISNLIEVFNKEFFVKVKGWGVEDATPVFIVGMPRSGTTLTEQILARHANVLGIGERNFASQSFNAFVRPQQTSPDEDLSCLNDLTRGRLRRIGKNYLAQLEEQKHKADLPDALRVVDKMPDNYSLVGWIATLFPNAKIIHCNRDPRDVALSCWMTQFGSIRWACSTDHLVNRVKQYRRVMDHWRETIPDRFLELKYEDLVANQESESKRLIEWIGMDWDEDCLKFYESDRLVRTASITQVRQPIYNKSVAKWKAYEPFIPDLFDPITAMLEK